MVMFLAFDRWPIVLSDRPADAATPQVSFVIGHRGLARLPHLLMTLRSIAGQKGVAVEAVVVEQSAEPEIRDALPDWVRYIHTPSSDDYSRASTLNNGVVAASGGIVVLHDNDMLVPSRYAAECVARVEDGIDFLEPKRFIFYLSEEETQRSFESGQIRTDAATTIVQNALGGSIVARRDAYLAIGGFDEAFVGWGGEDNEFWERAEAGGKASRFGWLPFVHLFHAPQKGKLQGKEAPAVKRYYELRSIPPRERIARLLERRR